MANYFEKPWMINPFIAYAGLFALFIILLLLLIIAFLYDLIMTIAAVLSSPFLKKYPHWGKFAATKNLWEVIYLF